MQLGSLWVRSRNFMAEFFDIVIVGGGPAGSTAGTLLAKHGWNVAILEKEKFPRFKIGESLLPGSLCTFERMGVREKIDQADVIVKYGGKIVSACGARSNCFLFSDVVHCKYLAHRLEGSLDVMASIPVGALPAGGQGSGEMQGNAPLGDERANALPRGALAADGRQ